MSATYAIGRGKPGAEKSFKGRLRRTVEDALARSFDAVHERSPANVLDRAVHHLVRDAADGNTPAMRLLLKLMDDIERPPTKPGRNADESGSLSLPQGKKQGSSENPNPACENPEPKQAVVKRRDAAGKNAVTAGSGNCAPVREALDVTFATSFLDTLS